MVKSLDSTNLFILVNQSLQKFLTRHKKTLDPLESCLDGSLKRRNHEMKTNFADQNFNSPFCTCIKKTPNPQESCLEQDAAVGVTAAQLHILVLGQVAVQLGGRAELPLTVLAGMLQSFTLRLAANGAIRQSSNRRHPVYSICTIASLPVRRKGKI